MGGPARTRIAGTFAEHDAWNNPKPVWAQNGVVVDIGGLFGSDADYYFPVGDATAGALHTEDMIASAPRETACSGVVDLDGLPAAELTHEREGGRFQVFAFTPVADGNEMHVALSTPIEVTLDDGAGG